MCRPAGHTCGYLTGGTRGVAHFAPWRHLPSVAQTTNKMSIPSRRHRYAAFGLRLSVPFRCRRLGEYALQDSQLGPESDVLVQWGDVPRDPSDSATRGTHFTSGAGRCVIAVESIAGARYLVEDGRTVTIEATHPRDIDAIETFLLGPCVGALLHQRNSLALHGAAVSFHGDTYVFAGASATGKSTIAAALCQRGGTVLTDRICVLAPGPGRTFVAKPGASAIELWPDAVDRLGVCDRELAPVRGQVFKRAWTAGPAGQVDRGTVKTIYILEPEGADASHHFCEKATESIWGVSALAGLQSTVYAYGYAVGRRRHQNLFSQLGDVARTVDVRRVPGTVSNRGFRRLDTVLSEILH